MKVPYRGTGKVLYKEKEYKSNLYYDEDTGGIIIQIIHPKAFGSFLELPLELDYLSGYLENGLVFTLINLHRVKAEDQISQDRMIFTFEPEHMISGYGGKQESRLLIHKVEYILSDIVDWAGESVYELNDQGAIIYKGSKEVVLFENDNISITYRVFGDYLPVVESELLNEKLELHQHSALIIKNSAGEDWFWYENWYAKTRDIFEFALLRKINREKVFLYSNEVRDIIGDHKFERQLPVYGNAISKYSYEKAARARWIVEIPLKTLIESDSISLYFEKQQILEPIFELFLDIFESRSSQRKFLNIVQALETYHSRFVTNDMRVFKKRVNSLVKNINSEYKEKIEEFFIPIKSRSILLESRIADLLYADRKKYFDIGDIDFYEFPKIIARTRNYYIHYDERIKEKYRILSQNEIDIYNKSLLSILEYYLLKEIGINVDDQKVSEKTRHRYGNISQELEIIKMSKSRNEE